MNVNGQDSAMDTSAGRSFAELLRMARQNAGLTQQQLAMWAGVSARTVSDLERGINRLPRRKTMRLLADALALPAVDRHAWESGRTLAPHKARSTRRVAEAEQPNAGSLPLPATSFVGRETEVAQAVALLARPNVRLLTLIGPGGVGKTRLAIAIGRAVEPHFPDGVRFVNLAPIRDSALVLPTIAQALGVSAAGVQSVHEALVVWLRRRTIALLLDNVEQVAAVAPELAALLDDSPGLTILATSRAPLHIQAEHEFSVPALAVPVADALKTLDELDQSGALRLFVHRAQATRSDFRLTSGNAPSVVAICARLEGLPLAIELAASRMKHLPPRELLERLARSLPLLTGGPRDVPTRQQTLFDTIAWSYELLSAAEQRLFRQLTIFVGGWTLEAAEAVCDPDLDVLNSLAALIDHNLVRQNAQPDGDSRYTMLEVIREFGSDELIERGEAEKMAQRHLTYVLDLLERAHSEFIGPDQGIWLERQVVETDNVRATLTYALKHHEATTALRLAIASREVWDTRSLFHEGYWWLSQALAIATESPAAIRADAYLQLGNFAGSAHDYESAEQAFKRAIELYRAGDNQVGVAWSLMGLSWSAIYSGNYDHAKRLAQQVLQTSSAAGVQDMAATARVTLALLMTISGAFESAIALCLESLAYVRSVSDRAGESNILGLLGTVALWQGDLERAARWGKEALEATPHAWEDGISLAQELLGYVQLERGCFHDAGTRIRISLALRHPEQDGMVVAECLEGLAGVAAGLKDPARGATLLGAAEAVRERFRTPIPPPRQNRYDRTLAAVVAGLSAETLTAAWQVGRFLSNAEAFDYGLEPDVSPAQVTKARANGGLSIREHEVLGLLVDGLADREIADRLFISHHTVAHHVASILNKLGVSSRTAAATHAVREQLVQ